MKVEPEYDDLTIVRMAILERDDRLVILMPPGTEQDRLDEFVESVERLGWPRDRIMVMCGPEAFAVMKPARDGGDGGRER